MSLTTEKIRNIKIGKQAHRHSLYKGKEISNRVTLYTKENNDFFNYTTGEHEEKKCYVCREVFDELYCFDQRNSVELLCCSEECYETISLQNYLDSEERRIRFETIRKQLDDFMETL
jgi:hypothetical protein